jgi:hypothetical protein
MQRSGFWKRQTRIFLNNVIKDGQWILKGQCRNIYDPRFFLSSINLFQGPDSLAKAVLHMAS